MILFEFICFCLYYLLTDISLSTHS